jgi:recombinational DNA repair protein RecR
MIRVYSDHPRYEELKPLGTVVIEEVLHLQSLPLPSTTKQVQNAAKSLIDIGSRVLQGKPVKARMKTVIERLETCLKCEKLTENERCAICGCHLTAKLMLVGEKCPINKW